MSISENHIFQKSNPLITMLPKVRGRYTEYVEMSPFTWFRVGGMAEVVFRPADAEDLSVFLENNNEGVPVTVIGATSNLLIRDGGIPGVVIKLGKPFSDIVFLEETLRIGSAVLNSQAAKVALNAKRGGLEFLSGIPGTIGGGLRMNAGSYGTEFKDVLIEAEVIDPGGRLHVIAADELGMGYRCCEIDEGWIFLSALFKAPFSDSIDIKVKMETIQRQREKSQPIKEKTGGSTFANPTGYKAWKLIDAAGCRGKHFGPAKVSEKHCNFLINTGDAKAHDLETLGELVRKQVLDTSGIQLNWEIRRIGTAKKDISSYSGEQK